MATIREILKSPKGIILLSLVLVFLGSMRFFPSREDELTIFIFVLNSLFWMLVVSLILAKFLFKEKPAFFGFRLPEKRLHAIALILLSFVILVPIMIFFSGQEQFQVFYSPDNQSIWRFLLVVVVLSFGYYLAEEFLFRGFLFWGLFHKIGYHSFWITSGIFALLHINKPPLEIPFSFFASLLFCYLSFKTKSFIPAFLVHFTIALILNALIIFT